MLLEEEKPMSDDELAHWLALSQVSGIGIKRLKILDERLNSMVTAWKASAMVLQRIASFGPETIATLEKARKEIDPYKLLEELRKSNVTAWTWKHAEYPNRLRHIEDPPEVLYVKGEIALEHLTHTVGVVGTRRPTQYGERLAKETAIGLSKHGVTVVSGLAGGIDSCAHWGAIEGGSPTIAVLGCGPDVCYPPSNKRLFDTIIEEHKGVTISEYFPGTEPEKFRFPARNRIISGLSAALVVVEGGLDSGSLITAYQAFDQNREVFAFPGRVDSPMSAGPHKLIRQTRAHLCTSYEDVLNELDWVQTKTGTERERPAVVQLYGREREIYDLLSSEPVHFDVLCEKSGMDAGEMSATLTMLELAGLIIRETGDWYLINK